ncbi:MAG: amidohydrolase family protein [Chloroflexi bacterium]|nr:amidohydrolase family protein [Chloroflexota bacterium]MYD37695.1 amidohydrolase family protein [Chloroflexota bacterium]
MRSIAAILITNTRKESDLRLDTLITNAQVALESGVQRLDLGILDRRIALLCSDSTGMRAEQIIDAGGKLLLPGAIDIHFHCRAPAYPQRGDFATETRAAAAGGVTTIFEMPISKPCCATGEIFRRRRQLAQRDSYVNFGLYGAPGLLDRAEITAMVDEGAIAFKIFMTAAPKGRDDEFEGLCLPDAPQLYQALQLVAETGLVCAVHAENNQLLEWHTAQLIAAGRNDVPAHGESRPPHVEALAIATLLTLNESIGAQLHIAHLSCAEALAVFRRFKATGSTASAETCPHYLLFTEDDLARVGPYAKINPPLRKAADQAALWEGLRDGSLMAITTDHSPFTVAEKESAREDIWATPPGAPGVEELLPGVMNEALNGRISLNKAVELVATNGAKRFGVYPERGHIAVGAFADLVIYDPGAQTTIHRDRLFSQARDCDKLYAGMTFRGRVERTIVNGQTVYVDGEVVGERGGGQFVRPDRARVSQEF